MHSEKESITDTLGDDIYIIDKSVYAGVYFLIGIPLVTSVTLCN